jgi:endo-1,4-beta-xylanase
MKVPRFRIFPACLTIAAILAACTSVQSGHRTNLKEAFANDFLIGAALNESQFEETDVQAAKIVREQFNSVSPENVLKWMYLRPAPGKFDFSAADRYVDFGTRNGMFTVGHNLIWHSQNPKWLFLDDQGKPADRATMLARMREHIMTVVERYRGRIGGWDVVNEALNDDGTLRNTPWMKAIGEDYLLKAYQFAHEADPSAQLYYNDFSLEDLPKQRGAIALVRKLQSEGVHIAGVGLQGHYKLDWPTNEQVDETIAAFGDLGVNVMITELDVDVLPKATRSRGADVTLHAELQAGLDPYRDGLPQSMQDRLTQRYAGLFRVFLRHKDVLQRVTFWGVTDAQSWLNDWPVEGRTSYPLLFGRGYNEKPAYHAVVAVGLGRDGG